MHLRNFVMSLATCVAGLAGPVWASDLHVTCVQEQLSVLGFDPGPVDGRDGNATRRALADFLGHLPETESRAVFAALPEFSERAAVGWCREIGNHVAEAAELMPAAEPPLILTPDDISPEIRSYIRQSYEDARQLFAQEYGIRTASKPVLIVAFGRDDLERLLRKPVPGIPDLPEAAARHTAEDLCVGVERVLGAAYRHRIALCMPRMNQAAIRSYDIWKARYHWVMLHEYMHHVQREMSFDKTEAAWNERPRMGPAWMVEGSAYMAEIKARIGPTREVSPPMVFSLRAADSDDPIPLDGIRKQNSVKSGAEYAASNLAVALLSLRFGEDRMIEFWRAAGELDDWPQAFEQAYGFPMTEFETMFEDLRADNARLAQFAGAEAPYDLRTLTRSLRVARRMGHAGRARQVLK